MTIIAVLIGLMLPVLAVGKQAAYRAQCLSNLRQMLMAANSFTVAHHDRYPMSQYLDLSLPAAHTWEISTVFDGGLPRHIPGLLWQHEGTIAIQQCPSFQGPDNWSDAPYTGYNYNTSYIGHGQGEAIETPARTSDVRVPTSCAVFGDGQWSGGANKFMRAPWKNPGDQISGRFAGTQGYRHMGTTLVVFIDGHAKPIGERFTETYPSESANIADGTGFLSPDNSLYDLN